MPTERIDSEWWKFWHRFLHRRGVSLDIMRTFRRCVVPWPQGSACPVWVPHMLLLKLQLQEKEKHVADTDQNTSKTKSAVREREPAARGESSAP
ncbi:hypothetical protein L226DRAFT_540486 [Lentinus tigrinus ALCF2SS1-7]|uniref:Uncharacterized protein n=1 Tax=Lentinus tigrinus ALCF2SS1-6 TaxID=1328759 RepID=A0A5C2RSH7_9APHY|nr:hypothetical protein L227DRAFT_581349 [Lentinus tigrinus ALCF2SS1-6]RPD68672.1 hypothetical protein L226DRAFT_540486 [Lentinus tigrinus ALCF2SS1-7]